MLRARIESPLHRRITGIGKRRGWHSSPGSPLSFGRGLELRGGQRVGRGWAAPLGHARSTAGHAWRSPALTVVEHGAGREGELGVVLGFAGVERAGLAQRGAAREGTSGHRATPHPTAQHSTPLSVLCTLLGLLLCRAPRLRCPAARDTSVRLSHISPQCKSQSEPSWHRLDWSPHWCPAQPRGLHNSSGLELQCSVSQGPSLTRGWHRAKVAASAGSDPLPLAPLCQTHPRVAATTRRI